MFTEEIAIDNNTPGFVRNAGDRISCNDFVKLLSELRTEKYDFFGPGGIGLLNIVIRVTRFIS